MVTIWAVCQPRCPARSASSYWRARLSVFIITWAWVDWRM